MADEWNSFYQKNLGAFGASAQGVGWKNRDAQIVRFEQLMKLFRRRDFTLNDLGCGIGDFIGFTREKLPECKYRGYDIMEEMIIEANKKYGHLKDVSFYLIQRPEDMLSADYTIASGIFNIRFRKDDNSWLQYILETLHTMDANSTAGFAFNILTKYSDKEYMKEELYYADPGFLFDYCKRKFSKNVALLHDYNEYDFTIIVRKDL